MRENNLLEAQALVNSKPYNNEEEMAIKDYMQVLLDLRNTNRSIFEMTIPEKALVLSIANSLTKASYKAQCLLYLTDKIEFEVQLPTVPDSDEIGGTTVFRTSNINENNTFESGVNIFPNPVKQKGSFILSIDEESKIKIFSAEGKLVYANNLSTNTNINTSNWEQGIYVVESINLDTNHKSFSKLIIH